MSEHMTEDLVLVAYLDLHGVETTLGLNEAGDATWTLIVDHRVAGLLTNYALGNGLVEPRSFSRSFGAARKRMYQFLDGGTSS